MAKQTYDLVMYLHRLVFDDRYVVVGERVDDLTEDQEQGLIHGVWQTLSSVNWQVKSVMIFLIFRDN